MMDEEELKPRCVICGGDIDKPSEGLFDSNRGGMVHRSHVKKEHEGEFIRHHTHPVFGQPRYHPPERPTAPRFPSDDQFPGQERMELAGDLFGINKGEHVMFKRWEPPRMRKRSQPRSSLDKEPEGPSTN